MLMSIEQVRDNVHVRTVDFVDVASFVRGDVQISQFRVERAVLVVASPYVVVQRAQHLLSLLHFLLVVLQAQECIPYVQD